MDVTSWFLDKGLNMTMEEREAEMRAELEACGGVKALAADLLSAAEYANPADNGDCVDVRLRYHNGDWSLLTGDASYDQDHRGYWGCSSVSSETTADDARQIAEQLVEDVLEHAWECKHEFETAD